jgi:hypothetical protein
MSPTAAAVVSTLPMARPFVQRCTRGDLSAGAAIGISTRGIEMLVPASCVPDSDEDDDGQDDGGWKPGVDDDIKTLRTWGA